MSESKVNDASRSDKMISEVVKNEGDTNSSPARGKASLREHLNRDSLKQTRCKESQKKQKCDKHIINPDSEGKKQVMNKSAEVTEHNTSKTKMMSTVQIKKEEDDDFQYSEPVGCCNEELDNSVKSELPTPSIKEHLDLKPGDWQENENKLTTSASKSDEDEKEVFTCDVCCKVLTGRILFEQHKVIHVSSRRRKVHKCSYEGCFKEFKEPSKLKMHIDSVHLNIRNFMCEFCVARFKTPTSLKVHIASHHTKKEDRRQYSCKFCSKILASRSSQRIHEYLHTSTESYTCSFEGCEKSFRLKENLTKHEKNVHKGVKPHQCKTCQQRFSRKVYLETHMYKHTGIKPFSCEECGKFFSQKGNLMTHMLLHNKERPIYKCPECSQTFNFKSNMTKHLEGHMEKKL